MTQPMLLLLAVVSIGVLLFLVIKLKMSAFVAMILVAMGTALAGGLPLDQVVPALTNGMGKTLGSVAIIVGLGAMLGRLIEVSGGAERLARTFTNKLGAKRVRFGHLFNDPLLACSPLPFTEILYAPLVFIDDEEPIRQITWIEIH